MRQSLRSLWRTLLRWWSRQNYALRTLPGYLWAAIRQFSVSGSSQAAALSYYAIFSVFPATLMLAVGINALLGPSVDSDRLIGQGLALFLPEATVQILQDNIAQALAQGGGFTLFALVGLAWSALGFFSNLSSYIDMVFGASQHRSMWRHRLVAALMAVILLLLIALSFVTSGLLRLFSSFILGSGQTWLSLAALLLPFSVNLLIFVLLFRFVPQVSVRWEAVWAAGILGAAGWELSKGLFIWYLDHFGNFAVVYGSIATVIVLLLSAYLTSSVVIFSAGLCAQLDRWYGARAEQEVQPRVLLRLNMPTKH